MSSYSEKLKDPRWQRKRLEILNRDNYECQLCNDKETELHVHHKCYSKSNNPWDIENGFLVTYCKHCHLLVEKNKSEIFLSVSKTKITDNYSLLVAFVLAEYYIITGIYNEKNNAFDSIEKHYFNVYNDSVYPLKKIDKFICAACGNTNYDSRICSVCGWIVPDYKGINILQYGK